MPVRVSNDLVEVATQRTAEVRVSADIVEAAFARVELSVLTPVTDLGPMPIGAYGDECNSNPVDATWTLRNIASVTCDGAKYSFLMDADGDGLLKPFTDNGLGFELIAHIKDLTSDGDMIGLYALDSSGSGMGPCRYGGACTITRVNNYNTDVGQATANIGTPTLGDHWFHLRRLGKYSWYARYSNDGTTWSAWTSAYVDGRTITQIGILRVYGDGGNQTVGLERFMSAQPGFDFTGFTGGAAVSGQAVEVAHAKVQAVARVSHDCVEVAFARMTDANLSAAGGVHAYGHSG